PGRGPAQYRAGGRLLHARRDPGHLGRRQGRGGQVAARPGDQPVLPAPPRAAGQPAGRAAGDPPAGGVPAQHRAGRRPRGRRPLQEGPHPALLGHRPGHRRGHHHLGRRPRLRLPGGHRGPRHRRPRAAPAPPAVRAPGPRRRVPAPRRAPQGRAGRLPGRVPRPGRGHRQGGLLNLSEIGEFGLIARLTGGLELGPGVEVGVGDDAAVLRPTHGHKLVVTTDVLVEGLDFTTALSEPEDWGWKAVGATLPDRAARGARPPWLVLALTVPAPTPVGTLERVYAGVGEACRAFGVALVGGDVSAGPALSLAVTALGEAERPVLRSGARPGDRLCVTGPLG